MLKRSIFIVSVLHIQHNFGVDFSRSIFEDTLRPQVVYVFGDCDRFSFDFDISK